MSCLSNEVSRHSTVWVVSYAVDHLGVSFVWGKETQESGADNLHLVKKPQDKVNAL